MKTEGMFLYDYTVNTFSGDIPVQRGGTVLARSEENAIDRLIECGIVNERSYEFLELEIARMQDE